MATPRIMIRFRDEINPAIALHNEVIAKSGKCYWGVWLKSFEDKVQTTKRAQEVAGAGQTIYIADTASKAKPAVYLVNIGNVLGPSEVDPNLVPEYYRSKIAGISLWFELTSKIQEIDADRNLVALLGVPTTYFLRYDSTGKIINDSPQREYALNAVAGATYVLQLSDIHLGEDHAFRYPVEKEKTDTGPRRTLSEVLVEDLQRVGAFGQIGCVIISGDIVTRGAWSKDIEFGAEKISGAEISRVFLRDLSEKLAVPPNLFCMVPGNHDIVREAGGDPAQLQSALLSYEHEAGFRALREDFSQVYRLSPLNYVAKIEYSKRTLILGLLNSAYLNEKTRFSDYGYVGDDADSVFSIMGSYAGDEVKILVLHHHLLPVYEREPIGEGGRVALTLDAAKILRQAQEAKVCAVLHGHQHATKKMNYASWTPEMDKAFQKLKNPLTVLAAGSAGVKRERLPHDETNAYGLIDLSSSKPKICVRRIYADGRKGHDWLAQ